LLIMFDDYPGRRRLHSGPGDGKAANHDKHRYRDPRKRQPGLI
jgi:hypothetical protein